MNEESRRLSVLLANLSAKAKDQAILAAAPQTKASLCALKSAALIAQLADAKKAACEKPRRRR